MPLFLAANCSIDSPEEHTIQMYFKYLSMFKKFLR